ncbi:unnamed protein product [Natator depressus]
MPPVALSARTLPPPVSLAAFRPSQLGAVWRRESLQSTSAPLFGLCHRGSGVIRSRGLRLPLPVSWGPLGTRDFKQEESNCTVPDRETFVFDDENNHPRKHQNGISSATCPMPRNAM